MKWKSAVSQQIWHQPFASAPNIGTETASMTINRAASLPGVVTFSLQRVEVGKQLLDLLIGHHLPESFHLGAAVFDDVGDPVVVRRQTA